MTDLTLNEYKEASEETLRYILRNEANKICGTETGPISITDRVHELHRVSFSDLFWNRLSALISTVPNY